MDDKYIANREADGCVHVKSDEVSNREQVPIVIGGNRQAKTENPFKLSTHYHSSATTGKCFDLAQDHGQLANEVTNTWRIKPGKHLN